MSQNKLSSKLNTLYERAAGLYDKKKYKSSLNTIEEVLKKKPEHADSNSLKGILLLELVSQEEALKYCKKGLAKGITRSFPWRAYGIYNKKIKNYIEACKCYKRASNNDKENLALLGELSSFQFITRDFAGYLETREILLKKQPQKRGNWYAFALANHLTGNYDMAINAIQQYQKSNKLVSQSEIIELALFQNDIIEESGNIKKANDHLDKIFTVITNKLLWKEKKARYFLKLGNKQRAEKMYYLLLEQNPDQIEYIKGLEISKGLLNNNEKIEELDSDRLVKLQNFYQELNDKYPQSLLIKKKQLEIAFDQDFKNKFISFIIPQLKKGIPSIFSNLLSLYRPSKVEKVSKKILIIQETLIEFQKHLESRQFELIKDEELKKNVMLLEESRASLLWIYFYLAQHYDRLEKYTLSFEYLDKAIEHTPTLVDLYNFKGRLFKHVGDTEEASRFLEKSRNLDLADRHINNLSAKYLLRNDNITRGSDTFNIFMTDLHNFPNWRYFEVSWMTNEVGSSYLRKEDYPKALKMFNQTINNFHAYFDNQFNYHSFCLREGNLRTLAKLIKFTDQVFTHQFFWVGARGALEIYLNLHDKGKEFRKELIKQCEIEEKDLQIKLDKELSNPKLDDDEKKLREDDDLVGKKLIAKENPLKEAVKIIEILEKQAPDYIETHLLALKVYTKMGNFENALNSINKILEFNSNDFQFHKLLMEFFLKVENNKKMTDKVNNLKKRLEINSLSEYNQQFLQKNISIIEHRVTAAEVMLLLEEDKDKAIEIMMEVDDLTYENKRLINTCTNVFLKLQKIDETIANQYREKYSAKFKYSTIFNPQIIQVRKQKKLEKEEEEKKKRQQQQKEKEEKENEEKVEKEIKKEEN
ncbi:n(alpha)-acetyltransferase 15/16 isoform a [Anaeramoeba flamelloides]|uniref:N(Alpha)-acetyltransferase 15/16 isoform a n=1 Tax=Anaeramoeba flamelloides TaxID=1746091 RepID=A0AAV8A515_9EUKA|nr:n(alpha)-acetyltransferase 15/16 isoform a [Anaeramoeba flamelloides]